MRSTKAHLRDFEENFVWLDMKDELRSWEADIRGIQDTVNDPIELYKCQGRIEFINNLLSLPSVMMDALEQRRIEDGE